MRDTAKGEAIKKSFERVQVVKGSLDDVDLIAQEARDADVVLRELACYGPAPVPLDIPLSDPRIVDMAATGHLKSVQTIYEALASKPKGDKSPYWVQIGGASLLAAAELADKARVPGTGSNIIHDDLQGVEEIQSLIRQHPSRVVDNYMLSVAQSTPNVKTAVVPPPIIYGEGRGPGNQRSVQAPELAKVTLQRGKGLQVGLGLSRWGNVHVRDLSRLFLRLVEKAVERDEDDQVWGLNGIYLTGAGEMVRNPFSLSVTRRCAYRDEPCVTVFWRDVSTSRGGGFQPEVIV